MICRAATCQRPAAAMPRLMARSSSTSAASIASLPASVRISSDLALGSQSVRHSAVLRIVDHHLHTTGLLPRPASTGDTSAIDIYCVGQAVTTYRHEPLLEQLHNPQTHAHSQIQSHVWLANAGKGSSLTFGSAVTMKDVTLALCSRVFLWIDAQTRKPIKITDEERSTKFCSDVDADGRERFGFAIPQVAPISFDNSSSVSRGGNPTDLAHAGEEVLAVQVGHQHMNHGDHVDHAFLADVASHALFLGDTQAGTELLANADRSTLRVQYLAPGYLGQELRGLVTKDGKTASVWGDDEAGNRHCLTLAQWSCELE